MSTALTTLPDMSTTLGQKQHYAAVKLRLYGESPAVVVRRPAPPPPQPAKTRARMAREYLIIRTFPDQAPSSRGGVWSRALAEQIIQEVADIHCVSIAEMKGFGRGRTVVAARFEAYFRIQSELGYSLSMIGASMGGRDHTGVLHGINKHKSRVAQA